MLRNLITAFESHVDKKRVAYISYFLVYLSKTPKHPVLRPVWRIFTLNLINNLTRKKHLSYFLRNIEEKIEELLPYFSCSENASFHLAEFFLARGFHHGGEILRKNKVTKGCHTKQPLKASLGRSSDKSLPLSR